MKYHFDDLKKSYGDFELPAVEITVEGKDFADNKAQMIIGELEIDLTAGFEASQAVYRIYGCTDEKDGTYLFDDLKPYILLGSYTEIKLGYFHHMEEVFRGFICGVEFACSEEEMACVSVNVMDIKGAMMGSCSLRQLRADSYGKAVKEILQQKSYEELGKKGLIKTVKAEDTPDKQDGGEEISHRIEVTAESDYEFIVKAAKKFNYEFFTAHGVVYFRKAKSEKEVLTELGMAKGILNHCITYDIRGIVQEIETRCGDDKKGELTAVSKKCSETFSFGKEVDALLKGTTKTYIDASVRTKEEAGARTDSYLERMKEQFGTLECECVGIPVLEPGYFLEVTGLGKGADNRFYITRVIHRLSEEGGYRTKITGLASSIKTG